MEVLNIYVYIYALHRSTVRTHLLHRPLPDTKSAGTLILDFSFFGTWRNRFLLFKICLFYGFLLLCPIEKLLENYLINRLNQFKIINTTSMLCGTMYFYIISFLCYVFPLIWYSGSFTQLKTVITLYLYFINVLYLPFF